jgi:hypothetical protein
MGVHRQHGLQPVDPQPFRAADGAMRPRPTAANPGREKKPSVISADEPSSTRRVVTPAQVTVSGASAAAPGTSKYAV